MTEQVSRRLRLAAAFAALLGALPSAGLAQADLGDTLGIDCEKPRRNAEGKLILGDDGSRRARCEADRMTALTYAGTVRETRDRLRAALATLPPPLWDDLVDHLRTDDDIDDWSYTDTAVMTRLEALSKGAPAGDASEIATSERAHGLAQHWDGGLLDASGVAADWRGEVRARACGFDAAGEPLPGAMILVWLDPDAVRDRWTPEMVQRAARAWLERQGDRFVAVDSVPDVVTDTRSLSRADGSVRDISADAAIQTCFSTVPEDALAMRMTLRRATDTGSRTVGCDGADQVGFRRFSWARQNGVFVVPDDAIQADGTDHPDRGETLLGQSTDLPLVTTEPAANSTAPQDGEYLVQTTCRDPRTLDAVRVADCDAEINGQAVKGALVRSFRFREVQNDPDDPLRIDFVWVGPDPNDPANELGTIVTTGDHPVWDETTLFCDGEVPVIEAPDIPPRTEVPDTDPDWTVPDCATQWPGQFEEGERHGYRQVITYPPGWPVDEVEVRTIDDDCFDPVQRTDSQSRTGSACETVATTSSQSTGTVSFTESVNVPSTRQVPDPNWVEPSPCNTPEDPADPNHADCGQTAPMVDENYLDPQTVSQSYTDTDPNGGACQCPSGWSGSITQERDFSWHNRDWAVPVRHGSRGVWGVGAVAGHYDGTATTDALGRPIGRLPALSTDPTGMPAYIRLISLEADWHEESNTCTPPSPSGGGGDGDSPWGYRSYLDGQVYERPAADGTSVGVNQDPDESGSAPSASTDPADWDFW